MADQRLPHLWIPAGRTRAEIVVPTAGGDTYSRQDLAGHSRRLLAAFTRSLESFSEKQDLDLATELIVQIVTADDRPASRERQHLRNLGFDIISVSKDPPNIAIARIQRESLNLFQKKLDRYANSPRHVGKSNLAAIEAIAPVAVSNKIDTGLALMAAEQSVNCLITLYASLPADTKREVAARIARRLSENVAADVTVHQFVNGVVGVSASLNRADIEMVSEQYMLVRSIEANGDIVTEEAVQGDAVPSIIQLDPPQCQAPVVIIDSGINVSCSLMAGLVLRSFDELPADAVGPHLAHGTFVASRVIYGDDITRISRRASPWCPVIDVQVTGVDGIGNRLSPRGSELGEILQRIVPQVCDQARVFNLSLGLRPVADGKYSSVASLIDYLSREHKVLFVISAGNVTEPNAAPPHHYHSEATRIFSPAESLLAVSVGAIARHCEPNCVAQAGELAPFSRRGPGADGGLKPELAAHGGNVFFDGGGWITSPRMAVYGLGRNGTHLNYSIGTSYSAPLVSQFAARLFDAYPEATPNLVRALLCHFSRPIIAPAPGGALQPHDFCGFGEPDVDGALFSTPAAASYLYQGEITKDTYLFLPFHIPQAMADSRSSKLTLRGTVVFDPPVNADDAANYSLCRIAGKLRKRVATGLADVNVGGDEEDVLLPWNPILHFNHSFRKGYAAGEWELRLRLITRGELPDGFAQTLAVVIEVLDDSGTVDVRTAIVEETPGLYVPVHLRIAA